MNKNGIVLDRNDNEWDLFTDRTIVYNLTNISKLAKDKLDQILPVIKKMILSSSFIFNWKAISSIQIILEIHMLILIFSITALMTNKEIVADKIQIYTFVMKFMCLNVITFPLWLTTYLLVIRPSNQVYSALSNLSRFILDRESLYNKNVYYTLQNDFSIKITPKTKSKPIKQYKPNDITIDDNGVIVSTNRIITKPHWVIDPLLTDSLINYTVNICLFFEEKWHSYQNMLEKDDKAIIDQFWAYNKQETEKNLTHFCKQFLVPSLIAFGSYFFHLKKDFNKGLPLYISIMVLTIITFIWVMLIQKENELINKMDDHIHQWNANDLIRNGKFVYRYHSLLSVFSLTPKGRMADVKEIEEFINKTFHYQSNNDFNANANVNDNEVI